MEDPWWDMANPLPGLVQIASCDVVLYVLIGNSFLDIIYHVKNIPVHFGTSKIFDVIYELTSLLQIFWSSLIKFVQLFTLKSIIKAITADRLLILKRKYSTALIFNISKCITSVAVLKQRLQN